MVGHDPWDEMDKYSRRIDYVMLEVIIVAMLLRFGRILRRWQPLAGRRIVTMTPVAQVVALTRGICYYQPADLGPFQFPVAGKMLLIAAFSIATIVWCLAIKPYYRYTAEWGSPPLAVRAGMLATGMFPFLVAAGLKVNPITMVTGISHERLQVYHHWTARLFLFFSIVHTIPFIHQPLKDAGSHNLHEYFYSESQYVTGTVAFAILVWIVLTGTRLFRSMSYEIFVLQHIASVIALTVMMFVHVQDLINSTRWLWAGVAIWIFSSLMRLALSLFSSSFLTGARAQVEVQSEMEVAKNTSTEQARSGVETLFMTFDTPLRWQPGQHVYVRFPLVAPLEAHPFTIMTLPHPLSVVDSRIVLMVRVHNGLTRRLFNKVQMEAPDVEKHDGSSDSMGTAVSSPTSNKPLDKQFDLPSFHPKPKSFRAVLEGPYGQYIDPKVYESVLFITGGSGITHTMPVLLDLLRRCAQGQCTLVQRVRLLWTMRSRVVIAWTRPFLQELFHLKQTLPIHVELNIYVSREGKMVEEKKPDDLEQLVVGTRPDVNQFMDEEIALSSEAGLSTMGVYVCGPRSLSAAATNKVTMAQWRILAGSTGSIREIHLERENFGW